MSLDYLSRYTGHLPSEICLGMKSWFSSQDVYEAMYDVEHIDVNVELHLELFGFGKVCTAARRPCKGFQFPGFEVLAKVHGSLGLVSHQNMYMRHGESLPIQTR